MSQAPRYDFKIPRRNGYQFASETDLEGLKFWHGKFSVSSSPQYAEKDQAKAKKLSYWVAYREADPYSRWKGTRGNAECVANQPSNKPTIFPWDGFTSTPSPLPEQEPGDNRGDAWEGGGDDIPF